MICNHQLRVRFPIWAPVRENTYWKAYQFTINKLSKTTYKIIISILLSFTLCLSSVFAQTSYADIQLLIKQEQYEEAFKLTEDQLYRNKSGIKLQFIKGLILTRLERYSDAEKVFIQLINEYPELPEPFNNLATVYAVQGKYLEAENGKFEPNEPLTRAFGIVVLTRIENLTIPENVNEKVYADVDSKVWAYRHIWVARKAGLLPAAKTFKPVNEMDRLTAAVFLSKTTSVKKRLNSLFDWNQGY